MDCDGNKEDNGDNNEGGGQATATATKRAMVMATAMTIVGNKEGMMTAARAMAMATSVTG